MNVFELDETFGLAFPGGEGDACACGAAAIFHCGEFAEHCIGRIDAGFRFGGASLGAASEPFEFGVDAVGESLLAFTLRGEELFFLLEKGAVVAADAHAAVEVDAIELDYGACDIFEEVAVVANDDAGEARVHQDLLEPFDAGDVEVICWLIEKEHVGFLRERLGKREAFLPTAGERFCRDVEI